MRLSLPTALLIALFTMLPICGCGGGGGPAPAPGDPAVELLGTLRVTLLGSEVTTVVDATAQATVLLDVLSDGTLSFGGAGQSSWVADITALHVHRGAAGVDGAIEIDLLSAGAAFVPASASASGSVQTTPALAAELVATPEAFYIDIHTSTAPDGLARGQLATLIATELSTILLGSEEVTVEDAAARGAITLRLGADKAIQWQLAMRSPAVTDIENAHIHNAPAGVNGGVLVDLEPGEGTLDATTGVLTGTVRPPLEHLARVLNAASEHYVNVHTAAAPAGIARGQLSPTIKGLWAALSGSNEVPVSSDPSFRGGATIHFDSFTAGRAHLAVPPSQSIAGLVGAHIHEGAAGVNGPVLIDLRAGVDYTASPGSFSAEGAIALDQTLLTRLMATPERFYVNFHTATDPAGAERGQLTQDPQTFFALMSGDQEVPPLSAGDTGIATVVVRDVFDCFFNIDMTSPAALDAVGGHVHDGQFGVEGPVLIDLLGGTNVSTSGTFITGESIFTGRTFARLLAFPEGFYVNIHTLLAPGGVVRGQLVHRTDATPPAGLTYSTPASYPEGSPITDNVPSSVGGSVSEYAIAPPLPDGLSIDTGTGIISGTPTAPSAAADYTVTATNAAGSATAIVNIEVTAVAPSALTYTTPVTYATGTAITANAPTNAGGVITTYSISPALPAGLTLNTTTGVISGTPTAAQSATTHTVTGTNSAGSTTFGISITVTTTLQAPSSLSYTTPVSYTTGTAITANNPTVSGGAVATWSVSPSLPAGLTLNGSGVISGTPTAITAAANYTVTAQNAAGSTTATVNIAVTLGAPTNLTYSNTPGIGYQSTALTAMSPSSSGGAVASYSITPALPAGITLNTTTGVISGTPTGTSAQTTYTITATNATGSTTATITIQVY